MTQLLDRRTIVVWTTLIVLTAISVAISADRTVGTGLVIAGIIITLGFVKAWLVGMNFMELRDAPNYLRVLFSGWCVLTGAGVLVLVLIA